MTHTLAALFKRRLRARRRITVETTLAAARSVIEREPFAMLVTHGASAWPHARLVQPLCDAATLDIWIGTRADLRKVQDIAHNPHVTVAFQSAQQYASLAISGFAEICREPELRQRYWLDSWAMFFPAGPRQPDYVLLHVVPLRIEVMHFRHALVAEPFGLTPAVLIRRAGHWQLLAQRHATEHVTSAAPR
jgi:general stress protein 26